MTEETETSTVEEVTAPESQSEADVVPEPATDQKTTTHAAETSDPPTLRDFFGIGETSSDKGEDQWRALRERLAEETRGIKWTAAMPELGSKIADLLDIKIHDVLLTAWKKVESVRQALDESKQTPEKATYLDLSEHSIDYETRPFIDVKLKKVSVKKLTLNVALNLKINGFGLKIQNGAVRELQCGKCLGKGTVKFENLAIAEKKMEPIKFPLTIKVPSLISIAEATAEPPPDKKPIPDPLPAPAQDEVERIEL